MIKSSNLSRTVVLLAHNVRSCHNVGSLIRTCDGLGVSRLILSGYTPYPKAEKDKRLPYEIDKVSRAISKTALGAEELLDWEHIPDPADLIKRYKNKGFQVVCLEQTVVSINLTSGNYMDKVLLIIGNEVTGIDNELLKFADAIVEIPMKGTKESFNVVQAAAMSLFYLTNF